MTARALPLPGPRPRDFQHAGVNITFFRDGNNALRARFDGPMGEYFGVYVFAPGVTGRAAEVVARYVCDAINKANGEPQS